MSDDTSQQEQININNYHLVVVFKNDSAQIISLPTIDDLVCEIKKLLSSSKIISQLFPVFGMRLFLTKGKQPYLKAGDNTYQCFDIPQPLEVSLDGFVSEEEISEETVEDDDYAKLTKASFQIDDYQDNVDDI